MVSRSFATPEVTATENFLDMSIDTVSKVPDKGIGRRIELSKFPMHRVKSIIAEGQDEQRMASAPKNPSFATQFVNCPHTLSRRLTLTGCGVRSSWAKKLTRNSSSNQRNSCMRTSCAPLRSATKRQ